MRFSEGAGSEASSQRPSRGRVPTSSCCFGAETSAAYPGRIRVESAVLGDFEVDVPAASVLDREVDVLWVATKATQLESALALAPPSASAARS